ncbi:MAG: glycine cleavage system aminomethyltransferase GcvT [Armatimonadaceae bacterium]
MCYHTLMEPISEPDAATVAASAASADRQERTPLFLAHHDAGAKMVPFAGWEMPVQYEGVVAEVKAVRESVGLFDVSHMGRVRVHGKDAFAFLQRLVVSDLSRLPEEGGKAQYSLLCLESGGIIDDIIVYRLGPAEFIVVVNAGNRTKALSWMERHRGDYELAIEDETYLTSLIAVQGPGAMDLLDSLSDRDLTVLPRFGLDESAIAGVYTMAARTGYTGEEGAELFCPASQAVKLWDALVAAGGVPCGLGARDTLRLEAALPLYGHEMNEHITPYEARLGWVVKTGKKADFFGKRVLTELKETTPRKTLVGIAMTERGIPREGYPVQAKDSGESIGHITSGTFSPTLNKGIAMARIDSDAAGEGTEVDVLVRSSVYPARIVPLPFYKRIAPP